jgi:hypothetical protein
MSIPPASLRDSSTRARAAAAAARLTFCASEAGAKPEAAPGDELEKDDRGQTGKKP